MQSITLDNTTIYYEPRPHPLEAEYSLESHFDYYLNILHWNEYIHKGDLVVDIGAYSGDTSIVMGYLTGKEGKVIAFEPNQDVYPVLMYNGVLNRDTMNIIPFPFAVAAKKGMIPLFDHGQLCNTGVENRFGMVACNEVMGYNLQETLFTPETTFKPTFVKIDCEGYDKEILKSHSEFIMRIKPTLFVERYLHLSEDETHDLFQTIDSLGYIPYEPITKKVATVHIYTTDLLCLPKVKN